ncbi:MAG: hypothetical protein ACLTBV_18680 [Enterocloster bolteae]
MNPMSHHEYYCDVYKGHRNPHGCAGQGQLKQASRHVDSLTYNRIVGRGFSNLTAFQQETIQEVVCQQADFEYENTRTRSARSCHGYSINGVSVTVR